MTNKPSFGGFIKGIFKDYVFSGGSRRGILFINKREHAPGCQDFNLDLQRKEVSVIADVFVYTQMIFPFMSAYSAL